MNNYFLVYYSKRGEVLKTFDCTEIGTLINNTKENRDWIKQATDSNLKFKIKKENEKYLKIKCHCGSKIELSNHINSCSCGRDFSKSGQEYV